MYQWSSNCRRQREIRGGELRACIWQWKSQPSWQSGCALRCVAGALQPDVLCGRWSNWWLEKAELPKALRKVSLRGDVASQGHSAMNYSSSLCLKKSWQLRTVITWTPEDMYNLSCIDVLVNNQQLAGKINNLKLLVIIFKLSIR